MDRISTIKYLQGEFERCTKGEFYPLLADIQLIVNSFTRIMKSEPPLVKIDSGAVVVIGDVHGDYSDLISIFIKRGPPKNFKYLLLGDYVDRGSKSIQVILYLMVMKILYPEGLYLLRGNHEFREICQYYGFKDECQSAYGINGSKVFDTIVNSFKYFTLAAIVQKEFFCVHGGLSASLEYVSQIEKLNKQDLESFTTNDIVEGLVWADPRETYGKLTAPSDRGAGNFFGYEKAQQFLHENNLTSIIRAHESCQEGFTTAFPDEYGVPLVLTIFSAANYCGGDNKGALGIISPDGEITVDSYSHANALPEIPDYSEMPQIDIIPQMVCA